MSKTGKDFKKVFIGVIAGLIAAAIFTVGMYIYQNPESDISWLIDDPINMLKETYFKFSIPMRLNMFIWGMTFFIYIILDKYDKQLNIEEKRKVRETNLGGGIFAWYSFFAVVGLIYFDTTHQLPSNFTLASNIIGLIMTAVGFYVLILARVEIDGLWGPHIYEYNDPKFRKIIDTGFYGRLRHPIYLGQIILSLSTLIISQSLWFGVFAASVLIINNVRAQLEEKHLLLLYPKDYESYKERVKKWWIVG